MRWTLALALTLAAGLSAPHAGDKTITNFRLKDANGKAWALDDAKDAQAVVVVFLGTQCPINNAYAPRLAELHAAYAARGVLFVAVNANEHDTPETIAAHAKEHKLP